VSLFIAIIMTINTSPGGIPSDREWDMNDNFQVVPNKNKQSCEELTN